MKSAMVVIFFIGIELAPSQRSVASGFSRTMALELHANPVLNLPGHRAACE